jgi:hypothetical protein
VPPTRTLASRSLGRFGFGGLAFRGRGDGGFGQTHTAERRESEGKGDKAAENGPSQGGEIHQILPRCAIGFLAEDPRIVNKRTTVEMGQLHDPEVEIACKDVSGLVGGFA